MEEMQDVRIAIVGDGHCGKSKLYDAMQKTDYKCQNWTHSPTMNYDVYKFNLIFHGLNVRVTLFDTAGTVIQKNTFTKTLQIYETKVCQIKTIIFSYFNQQNYFVSLPV